MSILEDFIRTITFTKNVKGTNDVTDNSSYENATWDMRPVQSDIKFTLSEYSQPTADIDPRQLKNFAYSSDVVKTIINSLRQEVFRKGIHVVKNYESKCSKCEAEYKTVETECPNCGGDCYEPPITQKQRLEKIIKRANEQQEMTELLEMIEEDADIFDNTYFVLEKEYVIKNKEIQSVKSIKFFRGDPIVLRKLVSPSGRLGYIGTRKVYTCPLHRGYKTYEVEGESGFCPTCGTKLYRAHFAQVKAGAGVVTRDVISYYIEGEVIHRTKFTKTLGYGISPMVTLFRKINTLIQQDDYLMRAYSEKKSPKGLLVVKTPNIDSFRVSWEQASHNAQMNPNMVQALALESQGGDATGKVAEYIDFMKALPDLSFTEQRDEFKKAVGAFYGVAPLFLNDTSASGGMNNERLQIVVSNRAIQMAQKLHNSILYDVGKQLGIDGWRMELEPSEDRDEVNELLIEKQKLEVQLLYKQLGFTSELNEEGEWVHKPDPMAGGLGSMINDPNNASGMMNGGSPPKYGSTTPSADTSPQKMSGEPFISKSAKTKRK